MGRLGRHRSIPLCERDYNPRPAKGSIQKLRVQDLRGVLQRHFRGLYQLSPTLGSKPRGSIGCRIEFDSSLLTFVVAVVSRPPLVELGSTAALRPGDRSHVRDRLFRFQLHLKMHPTVPAGLRGPSLRLKVRGFTIPDGDTNRGSARIVEWDHDIITTAADWTFYREIPRTTVLV